VIHRVFVYGTLKRGHGNWQRFMQDAVFLGKAESVDKAYKMFGHGIPFLIRIGLKKKQVRHAVGELYEVDDETLAALDQLEGHPRYYCREEQLFVIPSEGEGAIPTLAWVYLSQRHRGQGAGYSQPPELVNSVGKLEWPPTRMSE
jgi:gamma-glutamylcyclotransferase (GGCT)/AIG2-like uncharacterized protein YtfP